MQSNGSVANTRFTSRDGVLKDVKQIVAEQMGMSTGTISETSHLENDLGCDSLDRVEITMEVEDHFGIDVSDEVAEEIRTIGDIVDGVIRLLESAGGR